MTESIDRALWVEFPVVRLSSPITARGYICFVNIRPEIRSPQCWICDGCGERVTKARQAGHAKGHR